MMLVALHYFLFRDSWSGTESHFFRYYLFQTIIFMMVITVLLLVQKTYPNYVGFAFLGLVLFKLALMLLLQKKINFEGISNAKLHFTIPYLIILVLETLFAASMLKMSTKDEKNQSL